MSIAVGVVVVACVSFIISFIGLRGVLLYEKYAWMLFIIVFLIVYGEAARHFNLSAPATVTGTTASGNALNLVSVVYGSSASWGSIVSDFYVHYPVNTSKTKIFLYTTFGITIPTCIGMLLGACIGSALSTNAEWSEAYDVGIGELLKTVMFPKGFAEFLLVLLVLSGSMCSGVSSVLDDVKATTNFYQLASTVLLSTPAGYQHSSSRPHLQRSRA